MDRKSTLNHNSQVNQQAAINHQMHLQTIQTLTELYKYLTPESTLLRPALEATLIALVEPFGPPPSPTIITE